WSEQEFGGRVEKIGAINNVSIAAYLGKPVRGLNPKKKDLRSSLEAGYDLVVSKKKKQKKKKKDKVVVSNSTPFIERPQHITFAIEKVKNGKWKENVKDLVDKLIFRNSKNTYLVNELTNLYDQLPLAQEYRTAQCSKVY